MLYTTKKYREELLKAADSYAGGVYKNGTGDYYYIIEAYNYPQVNILFYKTRAEAEREARKDRESGKFLVSRVYHLTNKEREKSNKQLAYA
ncbi:MAG: hypothetical protein QXZ38_04210 [Candidatus Micrarchaeaceae archaeon]